MRDIFDRLAAKTVPSSKSEQLSEGVRSLNSPDDPTNDAPATSAEVKQATQELLRHGYLEESQKPELFRNAVVQERALQSALEPLDLRLRLDTHRGVAFLVVAEAASENSGDVGWSHPLVKRQRLTLEQSVLVAMLRQAFIVHEQESGVGYSAAKIAVEELLPQFITFFDDSGSDAKNESRLLNLLDQLKPHGIVSEVDSKHEVTIRPLIAYLANPESLAALLVALKERSCTVPSAKGDDAC